MTALGSFNLLRLAPWMLRRATSLPEGLQRRLAGAPVVSDEGSPLDQQTQMLLALFRRSGMPTLDRLAPRIARPLFDRSVRWLDPPEQALLRVEDCATPEGIPLRIYVPHHQAPALPVAVFYHGGGFVFGSLGSHDRPCRRLAHLAGCIVVAVDYRLAPEHPFPAAVEDALAAFAWVSDNARQLGADPQRIAVCGDSAGGNLSAVVCRLTRDAHRPMPCFQLLIYPATDLTCSLPSHQRFGRGLLLTEQMISSFVTAYLPNVTERTDPRASPLHAEDHRGLPPALVVTAGFDALRDEGREYVRRLRQAEVPVDHVEHASLIHGFFNMTGVVHRAREAADQLASALGRALTDSPAD